MRDFDALAAAPLAIAVVLGGSAHGHLRLPWQARVEQLERLALPRWTHHRSVAAAHPVIEVALALVLLLTRPPALLAVATLTLLLLLTYLAIVVRALRTLDVSSCRCFGALREGELTWRTVARDVGLVVLGVLALVDAGRGHGFVNRLIDAPRGVVAVAVVAGLVAAVVWLTADDLRRGEVVGLRRTNDDHAHAVASLQAGTQHQVEQSGERPADSAPPLARRPIPPGLTCYDSAGVGHDVALAAAQAPQLMIFGSGTCQSCHEVRDQLPRFAAMLPGIDVRFVVAAHEVGPELDDSPWPLWTTRDQDVAAALGLPYQVPTAVLLGVDGLTAGDALDSRAIGEFVVDLAVQLLEMEIEAGRRAT